MPSVDEINAAFDAVHDDIQELIGLFIPSFFKAQAYDKLASPQGRALIVDGARKALVAAEKVRAKAEKGEG